VLRPTTNCWNKHKLQEQQQIAGTNFEANFRDRTLGGGWGRLLALVPVTQGREQKHCGHARESANDKENAVGVNEAVRGAQAFDRSTGKSLQDLSQPGIG